MKLLLIVFLPILSSPKDSLTPQMVYDYCVEQEILYPEIVTAQSIQESRWYTCTDCSWSNYNNIFGFYYKGYKEFDTWKKGVEYYKRWQDKRYDPSRDYYDFLSCIYKGRSGCKPYAKDPELYKAHVKSIVNKYADTWCTNNASQR